jgi:hypothetical protein
MLSQDNPEMNDPLLKSCDRWITAYIANAGAHVTLGRMETAEVYMTNEEIDELSGPETMFVIVPEWVASMRKEIQLQDSDPDPRLEDAGLRPVARRYRGQMLVGVNIEIGPKGHYKVHKRDRTVVGKRTLLDDGQNIISETQQHDKFTAARDGAMCADDKIKALNDVMDALRQASAQPVLSKKTDNFESSDESDSDADNKVEGSSAADSIYSAYSSTMHVGGAARTASRGGAAPAKNKAKASQAASTKSKSSSPAISVLSSAGGSSSSSVVASRAAKPGGGGAGAGGGKAGKSVSSKWNHEKEWDELVKTEEMLRKLCDLGPCLDFSDARVRKEFAQTEKTRQHHSGEIVNKFVAKKKSQLFNTCASGEHVARVDKVVAKSTLIFKIAKGMCQVSTQNPLELQQHVQEAVRTYAWQIPAHIHAQVSRFLAFDLLKNNDPSGLANAMNEGSEATKLLMQADMPQDAFIDLVRGLVEQMAQKLFRVVALNDVPKDYTAKCKSDSLARLRCFYNTMIDELKYPELQTGIQEAKGLAAPANAPIKFLREAVKKRRRKTPSQVLSFSHILGARRDGCSSSRQLLLWKPASWSPKLTINWRFARTSWFLWKTLMIFRNSPRQSRKASVL